MDINDTTANITRTVLITGSGRGIGRSTAERLLADGWTVGVFDVSGDQAWAEGRDGAIVGTLDVTDPEAWAAALETFVTEAGGLDVLVNNAGLLYGGEFADADFATDARIVDVNVKGVLYGARAALPHLEASARAGRRPQLVNLSSAAAIYGTPDMATYSSTKFAVRGITEALEVEWRARGIRVIDVMPLYANTGMLDGVKTTGTQRMGVRLGPDDVAKVVVTAIGEGVNGRGRKPVKVHYPVGLQSTALFAGSHMSPPFLTRFVNGKLTTDRDIGF